MRTMKLNLFVSLLLQLSIVFFEPLAGAAPTDAQFLFEANYRGSLVDPAELNQARSSLKWNNTTPSSGEFDQLTGYTVTLGYRLFEQMLVLISYEDNLQQLPTTAISGASYTIADSFHYKPIFLMLDYPFLLSESITLSVRAGIGYSLLFEFYEKNVGGNGELVTWEGSAMPLRAGITLNYELFSGFGLFADALYEQVESSSLKAKQTYVTTINAAAIQKGQSYKNLNSGSSSAADLSGLRYGVGIRVSL